MACSRRHVDFDFTPGAGMELCSHTELGVNSVKSESWMVAVEKLL